MSNFLCFSVLFLDPEPGFHGKRDGGEPEWPPSPLRLFQALLDAGANRWRNAMFVEYAKPAFEWLQQLEPPMIFAPNHQVGIPFRTAVPDNDLDVWARPIAQGNVPKKQPNDLKSMKTVRRTWLMSAKSDDHAVHYLFPLADGDPQFAKHRQTLIDAARSITHLGWGVDMVAGNASVISEVEAAELPGERWRPADGTGTLSLRVPIEGTLADLNAKYTAFLNRLTADGFKPVPPLSTFDVVGYRQSTDPPPRLWAAFRLRHPFEDRSAVFAMTRANCVAAMTRCATARIANEQGQPGAWIDRYVHGHRNKDGQSMPRFSYLPLPSIERRGEGSKVLGSIRRVLVAELCDSAESHLPWVRQMIPGQFLTDDKTGDRKAMLTPLTGGDWVLQQYTADSHRQGYDTWATVTPVVLPGSDEGKFAKAERLLAKALRYAGYASEALADLEFRAASFWPGGDLALRFERPDYLKKDCWSVYHLRLRWKQPITGPLAIGAGRHCGLGIFAAMKE